MIMQHNPQGFSINVYNTLGQKSWSGIGKIVRAGHGCAYGHAEMGSDLDACHSSLQQPVVPGNCVK